MGIYAIIAVTCSVLLAWRFERPTSGEQYTPPTERDFDEAWAEFIAKSSPK